MSGFTLERSGSDVRELAGGEAVVGDTAGGNEAGGDEAGGEGAAGEAGGVGAQGTFVWEHIDLADEKEDALGSRGDLPDVVRSALVANETRPRCDQFGEGALLNMRGPSANPDLDSDRLVSIRIWAIGTKVISASRRSLSATAAVASEMRAGRVCDPGDLVSAFAQAISMKLDPQITELGDMVDDCETELQDANIYELRRRIAESRSGAIAFRRFIAPNRDALIVLAGLKIGWLEDDDRLHLREAADRFARMAEELEAIRERTALLHEQLSDYRTEQIDQRSLKIAVVAFIFLPLTFITGLLGMNVEGIPLAHSPWSFWGVVAFCLSSGLAVWAWFWRKHWLRR